MSDIFEDFDKKKFGWFHVKSILTTGIGVFTDGYDLSSVGIVLAIVLSSYGITKSTPGYVLYTSLIAGSALIGAAVGALILVSLQDVVEKSSMELMCLYLVYLHSCRSLPLMYMH